MGAPPLESVENPAASVSVVRATTGVIVYTTGILCSRTKRRNWVCDPCMHSRCEGRGIHIDVS